MGGEKKVIFSVFWWRKKKEVIVMFAFLGERQKLSSRVTLEREKGIAYFRGRGVAVTPVPGTLGACP